MLLAREEHNLPEDANEGGLNQPRVRREGVMNARCEIVTALMSCGVQSWTTCSVQRDFRSVLDKDIKNLIENQEKVTEK